MGDLLANRLDAEIATLRSFIRARNDERAQLAAKLDALKRERWPHKCCRCWPSVVSDKGLCGCCEYNHVTGERPPPDPDYGL